MAEQNMRLRVMLDLADRALGPLKRISQGSKETASALKAARDQLKQLNAQQNALGNFEKHTKAMRESGNQLKVLKQQLDTLQSSGQAGAAQIKAHQSAIEKQTAKFKEQQATVFKLRASLSELGISNASQAQAGLGASIAATTAKIKAQSEALKHQADEQRKLAKIQQQAAKGAAIGGGMAAAGAVGVYAGKRTVQTAMKPVQSFMSHEDAMLGVARQVPGARNEAGELTAVYRAIEAQVRELSTHVPLATTQIAEMFTAAARMEVPTDKLSGFVLMASEMATAFDAVPDEITESMGKVAKNFKIELTNIRGLADAINYLDDNAISKGSDIIDYLNRTSGVLSTVAMSERNAAALGSTLLTLGERAETASTATNAIISKFAAATKGTKKFQSAVKEIGLKTQDIETGMTKDAAGTLMKVMEAVRKAPKSKRMGIMVELVGMEHADTLAKLVDKPEELQRQIELANSKQADGSMAREASARNATMSAQGKMTDNRLFNLKAIVGESLKSSIQELLAVVNPLLERITQWTKANPALVGGLLKAVIVFGGMLAAVGALLIPLGLLIAKGFLVRLMLAKLAAVTTGGMAAGASRLVPLLARMALGFLRMLGPIGLLITSGWMVYSNWEGIVGGAKLLWEDLSNWLMGIWSRIVNAGAMLWQSFAGMLGGVWGAISSLYTGALQLIATTSDAIWQGIITRITGLWTGFMSTLSGIWAMIQSTASLAWTGMATMFTSFGGWIIDGLIGGITGKLGQLRDTVVNAATSAASWFKEKLGINSPSRVFTQYGGWISEGAALGIESGQAGVRAAALAMAAAAIAPMAHATLTPPGIRLPAATQTAPAALPVAPATSVLHDMAASRAMAVNPVLQSLPSVPPMSAKLQVEPALAALQDKVAPQAMLVNPAIRAMPQMPPMGAQLQVTPAPAPQAMTVNPVLQATPKVPLAAAQMQVTPMLAAMGLPAEHQINVLLQGLDKLQKLPQGLSVSQLVGLDLPAFDTASPNSDDEQQPAPRMRAMEPIAPRAAAAAAAPSTEGHSTYNIIVQASPGMDPQAIGRAVAAEIDRRERASGARRRSALQDLN